MDDSARLLSFDLAADEIHIFVQEADEHTQTLEENLVRLELEPDNEALFQATFRAAHTIKGSAAMIGHRRMADLTHAMESVLDQLRSNRLTATSSVVDALLDALDALRELRGEIITLKPAAIEVDQYIERLQRLASAPAPPVDTRPRRSKGSGSRRRPAAKSASSTKRTSESTTRRKKVARPRTRKKVAAKASASKKKPSRGRRVRGGSATPGYLVECDISPESIASAARAYQIVQALQALGDVVDLEPALEVIESAAPVQRVTARLVTSRSRAAARRALGTVPEITRLVVDGEVFDPEAFAPDSVASAVVQEPPPSEAATAEETGARLGEQLVSSGLITPAQLDAALQQHRAGEDGQRLLGQTLVQMGALSQEQLDRVSVEQVRQLQQEPAVHSKESERTAVQAVEKTVRISVERLDALMNLAGELVTDRNRLFQVQRQLAAAVPGAESVDELSNTALRISRITEQLQEEVMQIRMLPVGSVFHKFPRVVRDLARKSGKQVKLVIRGEETELDRSLLEMIGDPLTHIIRNAVDHGLEPPETRLQSGKPERGTVLLAARHEAGRIVITVEDDGRGIPAADVRRAAVRKGVLSEAEAEALPDEEVIDLIFRSGLSTAKTVTDVSGRGVGMDIVRANIERLNGAVVIETWPGKGTRFEISLPLTLAIFPALLVRIGAVVCALPLSDVVEALHLAPTDLKTVSGRPVFTLRDHVLPLVDLSAAFDWGPVNANGSAHVVVVRWGKQEMGLKVGSLIGEEDIVIKPLGTVVGGHELSGAAIMGDGRVALVLDIPGIFRLAGLAVAR